MSPVPGLSDEILRLLAQADRNQGELADATGRSYPEINSALKALSDRKAIEHYFTETQPPVLTYRRLRRLDFAQLMWRNA